MEFIKILSGDTEIVKHIHTEGDYVLSSDDLESSGFHTQPENVRFKYVFDFGSQGAYIQTKSPADGKFYLALQVQDTFGTYDEEFIPVPDNESGPFCENMVSLSVNEDTLGSFRYGGDDRKYYLFVTEKPIELKKDDIIQYKLIYGKQALFTAVLLLSNMPQIKVNEICDLTSENGEIRFWTRLASRVNVIFGDKVFSEPQYLNNHRFSVPKDLWGIRFVIEAQDEEGHILRGRGTCLGEKEISSYAGIYKTELLYSNNVNDTVPVTGVLPFAKGKRSSCEDIVIVDDKNNSYPVSFKITSRWQDKSVRTAAISANLPLDGRKFFAENGIAPKSNCKEFFAEADGDGITVLSRGKEYRFRHSSDSLLPDKELFAVLYDKNNDKYIASGGNFNIMESNSHHIVISRENHFVSGDKKHMKCISNVHFYRDVSAYALEFAFENDMLENEFTQINGLYLEGAYPEQYPEVLQLDEKTARINGKEEQLRCDGHFGTESNTVYINDFWQNYPKSFASENGIMRIGICPVIDDAKRYTDDDITLESRLFFYLKTGKYEFHCGLKKYHTIIFGEDWFKISNIPYLVPEKEAIENSCAFGNITCHCDDFPKYDKYMEDSLGKYMEHREKYREYGMLNYGDSFGEREIHWTNMEYDFPYGMLIHFLRTGDDRFYQLAKSAAEHYEGIDCSHKNIHFEENGYFFIHTVGHANNYYPYGSLPQSFHYMKSHIGHIFVHGMAEYYKATGIERYKEAVVNCANSIAKYYALRYDFLTEREPGWSMLALEAAYELTLDPYYLNACRIILERVYEKQDSETGCLKYFMYIVPKEGQVGEVCYGGKSFMHGIVGSAVKYFYYLTGDERAKECACEIARWLAEDMFDPEINQFWYTEGFKRLGRRVNQPETNIEILDVLLFACIENKNPKYLEIARKAFDLMLESEYRRECDISKVYSMRLRFAPEIMHDYSIARKNISDAESE